MNDQRQIFILEQTYKDGILYPIVGILTDIFLFKGKAIF